MKILDLSAKPVILVVRSIHRVIPHNKNVGHVVVGTTIMFIGGLGAHTLTHFVPDHLTFVVDTVCYAVHGIGCAPIIKVLADKLNLDL